MRNNPTAHDELIAQQQRDARDEAVEELIDEAFEVWDGVESTCYVDRMDIEDGVRAVLRLAYSKWSTPDEHD